MSCIFPILYILINFFNFNTIFLLSIRSYQYPHTRKKVIGSPFYGKKKSFYGWSFFLWSFHILYIVIGNTCYIFSAIFSFALLQSGCYNLHVCFRFFRRNFIPDSTLYRNLPYRNTLPKYTLS